VPLNNAGLPSFTGMFTAWRGVQRLRRAVNGTDTFNVTERGRTARPSSNHVVDHVNTSLTGAAFFFTHCHG